MAFVTQLMNILSQLDQSFLPNELAYLAATSKVESPIRDRVAFRLHQQIEPDRLVHREWNDPKKNGWIDIAITDHNNHPLQLVEVKAHSLPTFEANYTKLCQMDLHKMARAAYDDTECYLLFLFNHLYHPENLDARYGRVIKYHREQNSAARLSGFPKDVSDQTKRHWENHLKLLGLMGIPGHPGIRMAAGNFLGMPLWVHAYLLGPVYRKDLIGWEA